MTDLWHTNATILLGLWCLGMTELFSEPVVTSPRFTGTVSEYVASCCSAHYPGFSSTQLCVMGVGLSIELVAAHLILRTVQSKSDVLVCVVVPDRYAATYIDQVSHTIGYTLKRHHTGSGPAPIHVIGEGSSTKDRCDAFQTGGIVVITTRMLCADLLHRRLSPELVELCLVCFPSGGDLSASVQVSDWTIQLAFCVEILLRGERRFSLRNVQRAPDEDTRARITLLSNHPTYMDYLVRRHHLGRERLTQLLHVGDVQLFPRFRLNIIQHYEKLAQTKPLKVDSITVNVGTNARIQDDLLRRIGREVLSEIQAVDKRSIPQQSSLTSHLDALDHSDTQPRSRPRLERCSREDITATGHKSGFLPSLWSDQQDCHTMRVGAIPERDALNERDMTLDAYLRAALHENESSWAYGPLVESLLDLRHLLRTGRNCSPYDFFFALQDVLRRRASSKSAGETTVPAAVWTLSSLFSDLITVATRRIGELRPIATTETAEPMVVHDVEEDDDLVIVGEANSPWAGPAPQPSLVLEPSAEEHDYEHEVVHRLSNGWVRDATRRMQQLPEGVEVPPQPPPAMIVVLFGRRTLARFVERLLYAPSHFRELQLQHFIRRYQALFGTRVTAPTASQPKGPAAAAATTCTTSEEIQSWIQAAIADSEEVVEDDTVEGVNTDGRTCATRVSTAAKGDSIGGPTWASLHQVLMSQKEDQPLGDAAPVTAYTKMRVVRISSGIVVLTPTSCVDVRSPRLVAIDGLSLGVCDLLQILQGEHPSLSLTSPAADPTGEGPPLSAAVVVRRVLLAQQNLSFMRMLEVAQDEMNPQILVSLKVQLVTSVWSSDDGSREVATEMAAFERLAHAKSNLTATVLADRSSIRQTEAMLESGVVHTARGAPTRSRAQREMRLKGQFIQGSPNTPHTPVIVFDEREFRSMLPYYLYCQHMDLVPLTLTTADYVLSPQLAVERKSVPDYTQSLQSGRVMQQLSALSRKYERPCLLIEFNRRQRFRLTYSTIFRSTTDASYMGTIYARTARLVLAHPEVCLLWSRSPAHSAGMMTTLKSTVAMENIDPSTHSLTAPAVGEDASGSYQRDAAAYAARVLSRFPGVAPSNIDGVMRVCGSLAGLATIAETALAEIMGEEDARKLYQFLHESFAIDIN